MKLSLPGLCSHRKEAADFFGSRNAGRNLRCIENLTLICPKFSIYMAVARYAMLQCSESYIDDKISQSFVLNSRALSSPYLQFIFTLILNTLNLRHSDSPGFLNYTAHTAPFLVFRGHLFIFTPRISY